MRELIGHNVKIDFMGKRYLCAVLSLLCVAGSLFLFNQKGDSKYGTDFSGGYEFLVSFNPGYDSEQIRVGLSAQSLDEVRVQAFQGAVNEFSIRLSEGGSAGGSDVVRQKVEGALKGAFGEVFKVEKTDYVGPTVGKELRTSALMAIGVCLVGILIYIAFRFEFAVGLGTIVALFHDVVIATGVYLLSGHLISMATLAGALTIVGYSVNDTVVVFDRVREEQRKRKGVPLGQLVNEAINFTLSRTIITHMLTLFSALALYIIGGGEIKDLSLYLCAGIVCGSYSTIFVVSPIVIFLEGRKAAKAVVAPRSARAKTA
jgi:preprotein translocase subunit SecF